MTRRARRAPSRMGRRWGMWCSSFEPVEPIAFGTVAGTGEVSKLHPAAARDGGRGVELALRRALHEHQRASGRPQRVIASRADAAMVVERRGLRHTNAATADAARVRRHPTAQLERHAAVALLV